MQSTWVEQKWISSEERELKDFGRALQEQAQGFENKGKQKGNKGITAQWAPAKFNVCTESVISSAQQFCCLLDSSPVGKH